MTYLQPRSQNACLSVILRNRHQPRRPRSRLLRRLRHHRCSRAQNGTPLDHGGAGRHCHTHIIPRLRKVIDGEDQGGISKAVELARRRRLPLLPPCPQPDRQRPLGQPGHQSRIQRGATGRGAGQAGRLQLRAVGNSLVAARPFQRARFHLCHHPEPVRRAVAGAVR